VSARSSGVVARSGALVASTGAQPIGTSIATAADAQGERSPAVSPTGAQPVKTNKRNRFDDAPAAAQSAPVKGIAVVEGVLLPLPGTMQGTVASNSGSQQPLSLPNRSKQNMQHSGYGSSQVLLKESGPTSLPNGVHTNSSGPHHEHSPRSSRRRSFEPGELTTSASESVSLPGRDRGGVKRPQENATAGTTAQSPAAKRNRFNDQAVDLSAAAPAPKLDRFGQPRVNATNAPAFLQHSPTVSAPRDVPTSAASVTNAADKLQLGTVPAARKQTPLAFGGTGVPVGETNSALDRSDQRIQSRRGDREYGALPAHSAAAVKRNLEVRDASSVQSEGASSSAVTARNTYSAEGISAAGRAVSARLPEYGGQPMHRGGDQWQHDRYSISSDGRSSRGHSGGHSGGHGQRQHPTDLQTWGAAQRSDRYNQPPPPRGPPPHSSAAARNTTNDGQHSPRGNPHRDSHSAKNADPSGRADDRSSRSSRSPTRRALPATVLFEQQLE
jgi:hypothetical protein